MKLEDEVIDEEKWRGDELFQRGALQKTGFNRHQPAPARMSVKAKDYISGIQIIVISMGDSRGNDITYAQAFRL